MSDTPLSAGSDGIARLTLHARLDQPAAAALAETLREARGAPLTIDASKIESVSTLCLQVLLSAAASWRKAGQKLTLIEPSPAFAATIGHVGLELAAFQSPEAVR